MFRNGWLNIAKTWPGMCDKYWLISDRQSRQDALPSAALDPERDSAPACYRAPLKFTPDSRVNWPSGRRK